MNQLPETIICPYCGNIAPYLQEKCIKCGRPLEPIRVAMQNATDIERSEQDQSPTNPGQPVPLIPDFPNTERATFRILKQDNFLIRGAGTRDKEIAARFFSQLFEKNLRDVTVTIGEMKIGGGEIREYYFMKKVLDKRTFLWMAIRIVPMGPDLFVDWKNCVHPKFARYIGWWWLLFLWGGIIYTLFFYKPTRILKGFQLQESEALQLSVLATLDEAIEQAGIPKSMIQKEGSNVRVV